MPKHREAVAFAPASVGNVAAGFDLLGHALEGAGDRVTARAIDEPVVRVAAITGAVTTLPREAERNTAGRAVAEWRRARNVAFGVELEIEKGIPLGSGMGGSAASAVAAVVAAEALLGSEAREELYPFALAGEAVASGSVHGDNVGPQLVGGLVLAAPDRLVRLPVPASLVCVLVHPHQVLETRVARAALAAPYAIGEFVAQSTHLGLLIAGCYRNDLEMIAAGLRDVLVEPRRAPLVRGFAAVKGAALDAGALGASISGAGPSVFAWFADEAPARKAGAAMQAAFAEVGDASDVLVSRVDAPGARVERCVS
ncbi:MAG TPA: homoserine kinase [Xanthomonadales bacterium]|nr:homoserine kinase [Xanthomonadales bacterium]